MPISNRISHRRIVVAAAVSDHRPVGPAEEFLEYHRVTGSSPHTVRAYAKALQLWWRYLELDGRDWAEADVWKRLFDAVSDEPDMEYAMVDATIVKVHRHGQGAKGGLKARPSAVRKAA